MVRYLDGVLSLFDAAMTTGMDIQKGKNRSTEEKRKKEKTGRKQERKEG